nr:unnamed protein product [Spirometra erinaceieuropaei]
MPTVGRYQHSALPMRILRAIRTPGTPLNDNAPTVGPAADPEPTAIHLTADHTAAVPPPSPTDTNRDDPTPASTTTTVLPSIPTASTV